VQSVRSRQKFRCRIGRKTYRLILFDLLLEILQGFLDLLLHRGEGSSVARIHFLLRILRLCVVNGGFKVGDRAYKKRRDGLSNVLLSLDHPQQFIEFCSLLTPLPGGWTAEE